ncbi:hypothetical protein D9757_007501 [Collybiopsis confluens]|uniref:Uncharacterized protein n=1 Tax=Collybiopsis confluens TaxID=2823264 RepID=A0A8H5M8J4_9AGAR|nr:hypothetical protein D9757_007501 [Collybiopsis confluens]
MRWWPRTKSVAEDNVFHFKKPRKSDHSDALVLKSQISEKTPPGETKEVLFSTISGAFGLTLNILHDAASFTPIPYLGEAAGLAITIWEAVQTTQDNKNSLRSLAEEACALVITVWTTCDEVLKRSSLEGQNERPYSDREDTEDRRDRAGKKRGRRSRDIRSPPNTAKPRDPKPYPPISAPKTVQNVFIRFLRAKSDAGKVAGYQAKIKGALDIFALQSNITVQQVLSRIEAQQQTVLKTAQAATIPSGEAGVLTSTRAAGTSAPAHPSTREPAEEPKLGAVAFPTIFSFAGATFKIQNSVGTNNKPGKAHSPKSQEPQGSSENTLRLNGRQSANESTGRPGSQENDGGIKNATGAEDVRVSDDLGDSSLGLSGDSLGGQSALMKFTAISGDQNITQMNDHSQRWNYGNVYSDNHSRSSLGRDYRAREKTFPASELRGDETQRRGWEGDGRGNSQREKRHGDAPTFSNYNFDATADAYAAPGPPRAHHDDRSSRHFRQEYGPQREVRPHQVYYDENGVPAMARGGGRSRRRQER